MNGSCKIRSRCVQIEECSAQGAKRNRRGAFRFVQRLKAALHAACGKICEQLQTQSNVTVDKHVVAAIGDITFQQIGTFCQDLDAFAK